MQAEYYDAVIVGSGFGGSVMAYRLAEAGQRVCLLERGKAYPPGSFARSPQAMSQNFWDPSEGYYGLFNFWSFTGLDALVSSVLGGGSLIYANVIMRKPERWFVKENLRDGGYEYWPVTRQDLDPHYDRVEGMLRVQKYPSDHPPYSTSPKTTAFIAAAEHRGLAWFRPNLAVTFGNSGEPPVPGEPIRENRPNMFGRTRYTCRLCGECDIGCNYGSKNTLDYTYLTEAERLGADIRVRSEVRSFEPLDGGGYEVTYVYHDPADEGQRLQTRDPNVRPPQRVRGRRLILGAGSLGTTYLLLKNRSAFPRISPQLGTRFGSNGDLLTFAVKCRDNAVSPPIPRVIDASHAPVITVAIELDEQQGLDRGFLLEDGGYPDSVNWMLQLLETPAALWAWRFTAGRLLHQVLRGRPETDLSAEVGEILKTSELSAGLLPMLGMGRDIPDGRMWLQDGKLEVDWRTKKSGPYFERLRDEMEQFAKALGGDFADNIPWFFRRVVAAHPLGGCPMGRDATEGVVDSYGRVFNYPGLYVADGAMMPGPVGANPSLTIAALADRFADGILEGVPGEAS
jgi:cholesterol oxidase